jgi:hypothetical protein
MNFSRRKFMKAGAVAAAFAGLPLKSALASNWREATIDPVVRPAELTPASSTLPLSQSIEQLGYYSKSAFTPYVNTKFRVYLGPSNTRGLKLVEVGDYLSSLAQVDATANASGTECFSLLFTTPPGKPFQQETCMIEHEALGTFYMFLVPVSAHSKTRPDYYEAVIYRRPQSSATQEPTIEAGTERTVTEVQPARNPWRVESARGEREVFTFGSLIVASSDASGQASERPPAPVQATWVTIARDRGISGLKLGMTTEQVLALFPGSEADEEVRSSLSRSANQFGMTSLVIKPQKYSSKEEFAGISQIILSLLDGRVSTLYVGYDAPEPEQIDELVTKFSKGRNLPPAPSWAPYVGLDDQLKTIKCKDFEISVFAGGKNLNINYVQMLDTVAQQKLKQRMAEAKKRRMNKSKP